MTRRRSWFTSLIILLVIGLLSVPTSTFAFDDDADMSFGEDDVEPIDDDMTFAPGDFEEAASAGKETPSVAVVAVPGPDLTDTERQTLQAELRKAVENIPGYIFYGSDSVMPLLEERNPVTCVREPLCLASVGRNAGVQRILSARVSRTPDGLRLDLDFFDVDERLFARYQSVPKLGSFNALTQAVQPAINDLFGIRAPRKPDGFVDDDSINLRAILGYSTAGLAAASFGAAIYFGNRVSTGEEDAMANKSKITQVEAQQRQRDLESDATTANILYGLSAGLVATSVLLFVLKGDDAEANVQNSQQHIWQRVTIAPSFSPDGLGFGAHLNF